MSDADKLRKLQHRAMRREMTADERGQEAELDRAILQRLTEYERGWGRYRERDGIETPAHVIAFIDECREAILNGDPVPDFSELPNVHKFAETRS